MQFAHGTLAVLGSEVSEVTPTCDSWNMKQKGSRKSWRRKCKGDSRSSMKRSGTLLHHHEDFATIYAEIQK